MLQRRFHRLDPVATQHLEAGSLLVEGVLMVQILHREVAEEASVVSAVAEVGQQSAVMGVAVPLTSPQQSTARLPSLYREQFRLQVPVVLSRNPKDHSRRFDKTVAPTREHLLAFHARNESRQMAIPCRSLPPVREQAQLRIYSVDPQPKLLRRGLQQVTSPLARRPTPAALARLTQH